MSKLSPVMVAVLDLLEHANWSLTAYDMEASLGTCRALARRGKIRCTNAPALGAMSSPRVTLLWEKLPHPRCTQPQVLHDGEDMDD